MAAPETAREVLLDSNSPAMRSLVQMFPRVAAHEAPVIVRGESGVGKSLLAWALHAASPRRAHSLVTVDCRALELDGHSLARIFHQAARGTALFEEIAALPDHAQAAVAFLLEDRRLGVKSATVPRIIATSSHDLETEARSGQFRRDLLTGLSVVEFRIPPLRDRREDILPLASRFAAALGNSAPDITPRAQRALLEYDWPGNLRELHNAVQRAIIVGPGPSLDLDALPPKVTGAAPVGEGSRDAR